MAHCSRRDFLKTGLAASALAGAGSLSLTAAGAKATDWVTLGKSDVKVTRLAFGTGTFSGRVQRDLGQDQFTRLVRYAYDNGIRFFETAESYDEMHKMLGVADCAVFGIPDEEFGEGLCAVIQKQPGVELRADNVKAYLRSHVAGFKVPKKIEFMAELPREDSGKIFKRKLREPYWEGLERRI